MIKKVGYFVCTLAFVNSKKLDPLLPNDPRIPHSNMKAAVDSMISDDLLKVHHSSQEININTNEIKLDAVKVSNDVNDLIRPVAYDRSSLDRLISSNNKSASNYNH